jgi:hypothetical protein
MRTSSIRTHADTVFAHHRSNEAQRARISRWHACEREKREGERERARARQVNTNPCTLCLFGTITCLITLLHMSSYYQSIMCPHSLAGSGEINIINTTCYPFLQQGVCVCVCVCVWRFLKFCFQGNLTRSEIYKYVLMSSASNSPVVYLCSRDYIRPGEYPMCAGLTRCLYPCFFQE